MPRFNFFEYVGRAIMFRWVFSIACCLVGKLGLGLGLVSG